MIRSTCLSVVVLVASLQTTLVFAAPAPPVQNIIVIGWDGAQREHVKEMLASNELPVLAGLIEEGKMVDIDVTDAATDTKAGWTQILTGYRAEVTGVYSNGRYQPIPEGYSVFERLETFFGPDHIDTVAVIGKSQNVGANDPQKVPYARWQKRQKKSKRQSLKAPGQGEGEVKGVRVVEEDGKKFVIVPAKPWYNAKPKMDLFVNALGKNAKVGETALAELEKRKDARLFMFVHFAEPDHAGHQHGENSQEFSDAIRDDDTWTGKIIAKLKELALYEKTLVYIVVDHGFNEDTKGHKYAPYVFLASNDKNLTRDGDRMDIAPTLLKRMGVDLSTLAPPLDGTPLDEPAPRKIAPAEKPGQSEVSVNKKAAVKRRNAQGKKANRQKRAAKTSNN